MVSHIIVASCTTRSESRSFTISTLTPHGNMHLYVVAQLVMSFLGARRSFKYLNISMKIPRWSFLKHEHNHTIVLITTLGKSIWAQYLKSFNAQQFRNFTNIPNCKDVAESAKKNQPRITRVCQVTDMGKKTPLLCCHGSADQVIPAMGSQVLSS